MISTFKNSEMSIFTSIENILFLYLGSSQVSLHTSLHAFGERFTAWPKAEIAARAQKGHVILYSSS